MKGRTADNHLRRLKRLAYEAHSSIRHAGGTFDELLAERSKIRNDPALAKCPGWVGARLHEYMDLLFNQLHVAVLHADQVDALVAGKGQPPAFLRWRLRVDGKFVTSDEICEQRAAGDEDIWMRVEGAHVWNHKPERAFNEWKKTTSAES